MAITPTSGQSKVFGSADPTLTFTNNGGLVAGDFTGALARAAGSNVGTYLINLGTLSAGSNYTLSLSATPVTFAITPAASSTVVTCPTSVGYDGTAQEPCTVLVTGAGGLSLTPDPIYTDNLNAGTATAAYTYGGDANHSGSFGSATFTISPATLSVDAVDDSKTYGDFDPIFDYTLSGFVNDEDATSAGVTGSATCTRSGTDEDAGTYTDVLSCDPGTLAAANYVFVTGASADFTIDLRPATWTTNASGKTYGADDPNPLTTGSGSNFLAGDGVTATYSRASRRIGRDLSHQRFAELDGPRRARQLRHHQRRGDLHHRRGDPVGRCRRRQQDLRRQ